MRKSVFALSGILLGSVALAPATALAVPTCTQLATDPAYGLAGNPVVAAATSTLVAASGSNAAYCNVQMTYSAKSGPADGYAEGQSQAIKIGIGLPLNSADGGAGGVEGAWNGKLQNLGGGGCAGSVGSTTGATNTSYIGTSTDTGHTGAENGSGCDWQVNQATNSPNLGKVRDFIYESIHQQTLWGKALAKSYYGMTVTRNYWNGCSTGGRQGLALAQKWGDEFDGILAGAPAIHWERFQTAMLWGPLLAKDVLGGAIPAAKLNQATASAVLACDANDGVTDGVIDDPRTCSFSAAANICGAPTAPEANCLTADEASVIDRIWDGPRNTKGKKIWFGTERGGSLTSLNGAVPFVIARAQAQQNHSDLTFDWTTLNVEDMGAEAQLGSTVVGDLTNTMNPVLNKFRDAGGKIIMWHGLSDQLIFPRGTIEYYRRVASVMGGYPALQSWFRFFRAPGVGHCGGGTGPGPQALFDTLVNWVENGVAPDTILASGGSAAPAGGRTRPLCPYPTTAIYNGSGSTDEAANFHCGGNLETPAVVAADTLTKYKGQAN